MKIKLLLSLFLSWACIIANAQRLFTGKIVDGLSRQPLESAYVSQVNPSENKAVTNQYGFFSFYTYSDTVTIVASFIGYMPKTQSLKASSDIVIELQPAAINLKDAVIVQSSSQQKFSTLAKIDLDLKPVKNTQELMRIVPGLFVAQHAGGGKAEQIFLRGFDIDHGTDIQVSVDNIPVNMVSHAHGQGYADAHFIIPETINNMDFGTGPYYAAQGNLNTAGYINFKTYNNILQSRVQVEAGQFNTFRTLAMVDLLKKNKDKQSAYIASEFNYTEGPTINSQNFHRLNVFGKYNLAISDNTQLTAFASAFDSKWDASGQVPNRAVRSGMIDRFGSIDPSEGGNTARYNANIVLSHRFANGLNWETQAFYSRYKFNLYSNFTFYLNDPVNGDEIQQKEDRNIIGYNSKLNKQWAFKTWTLNSTYGAGFRHDATDNSQLNHVVKRVFLEHYKLGDIKETNAFAYIQDQAIVGNWLLEAGLRFDYLHFNYFDKLTTQQLPAQGKAIVSPKLNIQYTFSSKMQAYVKAGKGFHSNDTRVVVANEGYDILPAAYGADLGLTLKPTKNLFINIATWYLYLQQEFVYVGDAGITEPSGKTRRQGIDLLIRYQLTNNIFANANINLTNPRAVGEPKGADYIPLAPTFTSTGGLFYKKKTGINGGLSYRYIKDRPANEDNSIIAKGYFLLDGTINYTRSKYEIGLAVENIFNIDWNEAQFATESRLMNEPQPVEELHYTPGVPFFARVKLAVFF
ncbi:TonB-dependent receptor [soil metagenome]